jgi:tetratricopeptide (TPR) repeat protein
MATNKIMQNLFRLFLLISFFSCNNSSKRSNVSEAEIFQRASLFYKNNDYENSLMCFDSLVLLNPTKGEYYYKRGYLKAMISDDKDAMNDYWLAIKFNYNNKSWAFLNIGTLYRAYGLYDSAIYFYDKAIEIDSTYKKAKEEKEEVLKLMKDMKLFNPLK